MTDALRVRAASLCLFMATAAQAGEADVIAVKVRPVAAGVYGFDVTLRSKDSGWDYYAERFEVLAPDGSVLGTRVLLHPHDDEQPFTRELDGVPIAASIRQVTVRAWMKRGNRLKAAGGSSLQVELPR
jgi:hypothetical protein